MAEAGGQGKPPAARVKRGGLGRGLGALIPQAEDITAESHERPLDVLLPDLQGKGTANSSKGAPARAERGGSARELLSPRARAPRHVSRETVGQGADRHSESEERVVSRETTSAARPSDDVTLLGGPSEEVADLLAVPGTSFGIIPVEAIIPNAQQPRQVFDESELVELADSIREVGLLQPVVVRPLERPAGEGSPEAEPDPDAPRFELVMGERRFRAATIAGLEGIPAIIRQVEDDALLRDALIENLHRVQLNPLEEAAAYAQLMQEFDCTQEELSQRIARSRPQIANTLRLLKLPPSVQTRLAQGELSSGHARALLALPTTGAMESVAERIVSEGLSVRAAERLVKSLKEQELGQRPSRRLQEASPLAQDVAQLVAGRLSVPVIVTEGKTRGRIVITFSGQDDLQRIAQAFGEVAPPADASE